MSVGRYAWSLRRRVLGPTRVVTKEHVDALRRSSALERGSRRHVGALLLRELALGPPRRAHIRVGEASIELGGNRDFPVDWAAFLEIYGREAYAASYSGARVLDIGAHKGYFGAYALTCGASTVVSFEPATRNYDALARAAEPFGDRWLVRNAALSATSGTDLLLLDRTSWAHSLVHVKRPAGEQIVETVTLADALSELPEAGSRTIVKIDAEGSECDILARPEPLEAIDLLIVEWHEMAPCTRSELTQIVEIAGLRLRSDPTGPMRFARERSHVPL